MSRRKTVKLNIDFLLPLIKNVCRSNIVFCEKMGRSSGQWVSDWQRKDESGNPTPRNLPSPEEAARMCVLLKTTPDDILLREGKTPEETAKCLKDIETVRKLVEAEGIKEAPDPKIEGLSADELRDLVQKTNDRDVLLMVLDEVNKKLQELR